MNRKAKIIEKISSIEDDDLLDDIDRWVSSLLDASISNPYTKEEIEAVKEGYSQYKAGDTFSQEEAKEMFNTWLKGK